MVTVRDSPITAYKEKSMQENSINNKWSKFLKHQILKAVFRLGNLIFALFFLISFQFFCEKSLHASFDESYFDIAGIKMAYSMYQSEFKDTTTTESGFGYGGGLFYDRQITGYFTLSYNLEYFYRQVDVKMSELTKAQAKDLVLTNNQSYLNTTLFLKYFPTGDFWIGLGPTGYFYHKPRGRTSDAGVAFALGYNFWITWSAKSDFDDSRILKVLVIVPEIRGGYNITNLNNSKNQFEVLFYLGVATRAYRPGY